ncbi:MAG: MnhB domain-containing protein [Candidatus Omnitrophota bacterium]|jgi:multicomponent Na+:H+ antiporter subunit B
MRTQKGMSVIVKTVTKITLGFIMLYAVYISLNGHAGPGGGFAGGVIVALSFVHIMLAFGKETALKRLKSYVLRALTCAGALIFLYVAAISFKGSSNLLNIFFKKAASYRLFNSEIVLPLAEMVIVGAGLFAIFVALVLLSKPDRYDSE